MSSTHRSRHNSRSRHRTLLIIVLSIACFCMFIALLVMSVKLNDRGRELADVTFLERKHARKLERLEPRVAELEQEIAALVESRLPHLTQLQFDKVFKVDQAYVKNIVFSLAGKGGFRNHEYKLVMENREFNSIQPNIQVLIFDRNGIQIGLSELGVSEDGKFTQPMLEHEEIRSHVDEIVLSEDATPAYFMVRVKDIPLAE